MALFMALGYIKSASAEKADVEAAITRASNGATVKLPAGASATWDGAITLVKPIILDGNGSTITKDTAYLGNLLTVTTHTTVGTRITGFNWEQDNGVLDGVTQNRVIQIGGGFANAKFRIDGCTFTQIAGGSGTQFQAITASDAWGCIDNNTFTPINAASELIHDEGYGSGDATGWGVDVVPGSLDAVYIENNTFNLTGNACSGLQCYYGSRTVFRYNDVINGLIDVHGGGVGAVSGRWFEIYRNAWSGANKLMGIRGGSGYIYENTGCTNIYFVEEKGSHVGWPAVYPQLYQVGRGKDQALDPVHAWNNTDSTLRYNVAGVAPPAHDDGDVPYPLIAEGQDVLTTPVVYTVTCPHPLAATGAGSCSLVVAGRAGYVA